MNDVYELAEDPQHEVTPPVTLWGRIAFVLRLAYCVFSFAAMFVLVRVWGKMMPSHSFFYSVSWGLGFVPCFGFAFGFSRLVLKSTPAVLDAPWPAMKQACFIGFTFAVNYLGVSTSAPHVGGPAQVIASQVPIVVAAVLTRIAFGRKYTLVAWAGVAITVGGTLTQGLTGDSKGNAPIGWFLLFALGNLPTAIWAVIFEGFFRVRGSDGKQATMELRMMLANVWIVIWLIVFIPLFGLLKQPPFESFIGNFTAAFQCVTTGSGGYPEDNCEKAGYVLLATIPLAAMQSHSQILLSRSSSGILATLCLAVAPFLADLVFPQKAIMGEYADPVGKWDGVAAALCIVGVVTFVIGEHMRGGKNPELEAASSNVINWFAANKVPRCLRPLFGDGDETPANEKTLLIQSEGNHTPAA